MDHTLVPPSQQNKSNSKATRSSNQTSNRQAYASWNYPEPWTGEDEEWDYHSSRSSSPRQRTQSPRQRQEPRRQRKPNQNQRGRGAGKGKNQMKGGAKGKGKGKPAIEPPPWTTNATTSTSASAAAPSAGPTKAEVKLMEIVSVLKKKDDPELQTLAKEADVLHHKNATSKLHKAVTIHGDVKTMMLEARQARANLHASWKQYLESAIETGKSFVMDFDKEDRKLEEQIILAETALATAQEALDDAKKVATEEELKDQVETIEDEEEAVDRTVKTSQIMREGLSGMLDGLVQLKARTEDIGEEQGNKRQRTDDGLAKSSAMQPFGGAGR